jgi:hypothetical protein
MLVYYKRRFSCIPTGYVAHNDSTVIPGQALVSIRIQYAILRIHHFTFEYTHKQPAIPAPTDAHLLWPGL